MRNLGAGTWIWGTALALSLAFTAWYHNWSGPLTAAEISAYVEQLQGRPGSNPEAVMTLKTFLEADDGREFIMLNVIKLHADPQPHPQTGEPTDAAELLGTYSSAFIGRLLRSAGHPVFVADKVGPFVDTFGVTERPDWTFTSMVRYRSRRDLAEAATYEGFPGAHLFKTAAIENTFNFPTQTQIQLFFSPGLLLPLLLFFVASLTHLVVMVRRQRP
ncbi:hypothetical protein [Pyruvatibacter sp.]